ncbi:uncharacterized protein LOC127813510 isoform X2 [Diospyros lotus]|uniref:uncharacterized protein LOC127813510 isoform X2 n=1 Tax=Diospyros lotus TaxID=55363 RepID=UPI0022591198|nr:uncharacterized protein LOC127813510 isoform X2 [Diospyros lotus]
MWFGGLAGGGAGGAKAIFLRFFSRKCAPNLRKINPKVPPQEAASIAEGLYHVIKQHGPLTTPNTWNHVKEAGISGLNSKTHMKIMLKWMRGRKMLKQSCSQVGSSKKFFLSTLPEAPQTDQSLKAAMELDLQTDKSSRKKKKRAL